MFGEKGDESLVGLAVDRRGVETDFKGIAIHPDDFGLGGTGDNLDGNTHNVE